ncbi:helix-turn-helix transcriptional regulator [Clostridium paridis]|uniref:Helix-turn-helix transcriptional regulator n=1 Tax=Clostridium paridis TaxID=2803863 RepID=A0A937FFT7_9CLOT|nr:helix-turn-helix transcriptional regulator [Clostridium paridis]MBL4933024.1 helix-turn-helix transcriptional regulator [Clostridium paridis]
MMILKTKEYRKINKLSISQLSYKSKVARSYISELEEGKYDNPGIQVVCKLCKALKITPNDLINEELWKWGD